MAGKERPPGHSYEKPLNPSPLPPGLAEFLKDRPFACLMHGTDHGTVFVVKLPGQEIVSARGRVPIHFRHVLYEHTQAPVIRTVIRIYDQPRRPLALETFTNVEDPQQREDFAGLARQKTVLLLMYDETLTHRLTKAVNYLQGEAIPEIISRPEQTLATIPKDGFNLDTAKEDVIRRTSL